jgi:transglutaminase-like putative cysteine protease
MNRARWQIQHRTAYSYSAPARDSFNDVRLEPLSSEGQTVESFVLTTIPSANVRNYRDFYFNRVHHFEIFNPHESLVIESKSVVVAHPPRPLAHEATVAPLTALADFEKSTEYVDYLGASRFVDVEPATWRLAVDATVGITDAWQAALALMRFVRGHLKYTPASTHVHTHVRDVLAQRRGVCQDFAHVMLGLCRSLKMPARYVSGYLAAEKARATHAWVEVWIPTVGWLALDPTHNCQIDETYIKIGAGRDYADVPPVAGYYKGTLERKLEVDVKIEPLASKEILR